MEWYFVAVPWCSGPAHRLSSLHGRDRRLLMGRGGASWDGTWSSFADQDIGCQHYYPTLELDSGVVRSRNAPNRTSDKGRRSRWPGVRDRSATPHKGREQGRAERPGGSLKARGVTPACSRLSPDTPS